jgi:hypothetical protein
MLNQQRIFGEEANEIMARTRGVFAHLGVAEVLRRGHMFLGPELQKVARTDLDRATKPRGGDMNVNVKIEQQINTEGDPDRLLIATKKAMQEALHRPLRSYRRHVLGA